MTTQLYEGDVVMVHVETEIFEQLKNAATFSSGDNGGGSLDQLKPDQLKAIGYLAQAIKEGKVSDDLGKMIAAEIGRSGASALCMYFGADPGTAVSLCGSVGAAVGEKVWPYIKKGGEVIGKFVTQGGSYAYNKSKELISKMEDALTLPSIDVLEQLKNATGVVPGNVAGYISCIKDTKDPFSCAQQTGVELIYDALGPVGKHVANAVEWGRDAACSTLGYFCKSSPPAPPPPAPSLPPEPSIYGKPLNQFLAEVVVYVKQYATRMTPEKLDSLLTTLQIGLNTSIAYCSSSAWAKISEKSSDVCEERTILATKNGMNAILNDPASADPTYALELVKAVRFGIAMDAVEFVLASSAGLAMRLAILFNLSNKNDGAIPPDVGHALFLSQVASTLGAGISSPEESYRIFGVKDAASMIWYGLLGAVDKNQVSAKEAGSKAVHLMLQFMAENMPRKDMEAVVAKMVVSKDVSPEEAERGVAEGLSKQCKGNGCLEKATEEARAIILQADTIVAENNFAGDNIKEFSTSENQSSSKDGLPWWGWLLIGTGVVGGAAAIYRMSQGLPILPTNWSKPLSLRGFHGHRSIRRHRRFILQKKRDQQGRLVCSKQGAKKQIFVHRERSALRAIDRR